MSCERRFENVDLYEKAVHVVNHTVAGAVAGVRKSGRRTHQGVHPKVGSPVEVTFSGM